MMKKNLLNHQKYKKQKKYKIKIGFCMKIYNQVHYNVKKMITNSFYITIFEAQRLINNFHDREVSMDLEKLK